MKKLALALAFIAGISPVIAQDAKPTVWILVIQLRATSLNATYQTEAACQASMKVAMQALKKQGLGRADCIPVMQP